MLAAVTCSAVEDNHDCQIQSVLDKHGPNEYINVQLFKHLKKFDLHDKNNLDNPWDP